LVAYYYCHLCAKGEVVWNYPDLVLKGVKLGSNLYDSPPVLLLSPKCRKFSSTIAIVELFIIFITLVCLV